MKHAYELALALDNLNRLTSDLTILMYRGGMERSMEINELLTQLEVISIKLGRLTAAGIIEAGE